MRSIKVKGFQFFVEKTTREAVASMNLINFADYETFHLVHDAVHMTKFILAKGNRHAPDAIVVWYSNGSFWSGTGKTQKEAIEGAMEDAWRYV